MVKTPNKGLHLYFRQPPGEPLGNGRGTLPAGCDVRGAGGFVIGPGATLPDGRGWIRVAERPPVTQAAQLTWIESVLRRPAEPPREEHPAGETSDPRGRAYAEQALHEIEHELAATRKGERNEKLYKAAFRLGTMAARGWLTEAEIEGALRCACQANGLVKDDGAAAFRGPRKRIERWPKGSARGPQGSRAIPRRDMTSIPATPRRSNQTLGSGGSGRQQRNTGKLGGAGPLDPGQQARRAAGPSDRRHPVVGGRVDRRGGKGCRRHRRSCCNAVFRCRVRIARYCAAGAGNPVVAYAGNHVGVPDRAERVRQDTGDRCHQAAVELHRTQSRQ